ncbi:MAG TPA: 2-phospho-L-lactate transferase CofD family protein, partial [Acidimicrobiales bacterium]|nr:2-phospho-L-lactate transferase CofD family protein [Acidimicrobiales bacterium]
LAVVAVPAIREALAATEATKVYVCNIRPQVPETEGYDTAAHVEALLAHGLDVDVVLRVADAAVAGSLHPALSRAALVEAPIARADGTAHDPARLAEALADLVG